MCVGPDLLAAALAVFWITDPLSGPKGKNADTSPVWSPDGACLVFVSDRDGDTEIYAMNVDGSGVVQLTNN